ncbi:hypothetical protein CBW56_05540 [Denitratisoma oestradiolicum]|nr:hypothetical protein CBW56_05540 [Denitratisoma oestradiolicum]
MGSVRRLLAHGLELLQTRVELLVVEVEEERNRLLHLLALGLAGICFLAIGLAFLAAFLTVLLWDSHRLLALGVFSGLFLALAGGLLWLVVNQAGSASRPFSASLSELSRDRAALEPRE